MISLHSPHSQKNILILSLHQAVDMNHRLLLRKEKIQKVFVNQNKEWMFYLRLQQRLERRQENWQQGIKMSCFYPIINYARALIHPPVKIEYHRGLEVRFFNLPLLMTPTVVKHWNKYPAMKFLLEQEIPSFSPSPVPKGFWIEPGIRRVFKDVKHFLPDPVKGD